MVNTVTPRAPLGASTNNRKWYLDVYQGSNIIGVFGITDFKNLLTGSAQDDSDFDSDGWKSSTNTANAWGAEIKVGRKTLGSNATAYDPGQEILRKAARKTGILNRVRVRIYEMEEGGPRVEAYEGSVAVMYSEDGGNMEALSMAAITLTGQGKPIEITHPEGTTGVPTIYSVLASGAIAGDTVAIEGVYFTGVTGATGVKFGTANATSYKVLSDSTILAVVPAGVAGPTTVTVLGGQPFNYTRGA